MTTKQQRNKAQPPATDAKHGWTPEYVRFTLATIDKQASEVIAEDHNAAIAAERENVRQRAERTQQLVSENVVLRQQLSAERDKSSVRETELICERDYFKKELAAERENTKSLVDALVFFSTVIKCGKPWTMICQQVFGDALAKVKEGK
jgi:hypothetical protein